MALSPSCVLVEGLLQTIAAGRAATNNTRPCPGSSLISYALRNGTSMSHSTFLGVHKCSRVPTHPLARCDSSEVVLIVDALLSTLKVSEKRFFACRFLLCVLTPTCRAGAFGDPMPTKDVWSLLASNPLSTLKCVCVFRIPNRKQEPIALIPMPIVLPEALL